MAAGGFVSRAFESMLKECTGKKHLDLQKSVHIYLDSTKEVIQQPDPEGAEGTGDAGKPAVPSRTITTALANAGLTLEGTEVELVLNPLRLAFETKNLKILEPALDCLHKLIAYDHLEGDPGLDGGKNVTLFTEVLNMVCGCVDNTSPDSTILQVLKVLLTAVASSKFRVHGEPLLGVIRVCYNIALQSKSPINQATSKAMLTQMISIVFKRMETDRVQVSSSTVSSDHTEALSAGDSGSKAEETNPADQSEKEMTDRDALSQVKDNAIVSIEEIYKLSGGADIKGLEAALDKVVHVEDGQKIKRGIDLESLSIGKRDALLVFRSLCEMGIKEETDEVSVKTRILSLELLQGLLEGVSNSFSKDFHFIDSIKAYLSYALLRASVSRSPAIFQYATGIFFVLLLRFRESLKGEIGVFLPLVVLWSLDGSECPINLKISALRMLEKVCEDPQMLVDIYVNYDCNCEAPNMFERMVTTLSKIAQGTQIADQNSIAMSQATSIKGSSLQCLVNVLKSLVDWEKSRRQNLRQNIQSVEEQSGRESVETNRMEDVPSNVEKAEAQKTTVEAAISEFNRHPVNGVEHLVSNKLVENNPASVAQFLRNTPSLDKAMIGDYMGQHEQFPLAVMHAYMDSMKFTGMKFDTAIRELLKGFRLPEEAQKIDRIMEKFAERYAADNPGLFKNADAAYVLAYTVIVLNTNVHDSLVRPKMSKSDFIHVNAMNDPEECAPKELLEEIYDSVLKEEIKMKEDGPDSGKASMQDAESEERGRVISILNLALPRRKSSTDVKSESEAIFKQTQDIILNQGAKRGVFYSLQQIELVRPMVEAVGWSLLATFSVTMGEGDNKPRVVLCMEGFKAGIHITHVLGMDTMRFAFLTSLVRFTFLHAPREMRSKTVEALRVLLTLCESEPESFQDTWSAVLECVSRLEYITASPSIAAIVMYGSNQVSRDAVVQSLKELAGKPADQLFVNSVKLSSESVVEFFNALCHVSAEELKQTPARIFSLQKLVEVSYYNMARIRMVWARIWSVLANHFISAGCHHDEKIATYAIDSLKQLGMKYLKHAELANFTFQNDILKPFVVLISNSQNATIRRLIVDCIVQMIKSKVVRIKSGWRSVFMIFTAAADDDLESIIERGFENVEQVILEHFNQVVGVCFMDCVNCLVRFANNKCSHPISLKAIALLRICETRLAEGLLPGGALRPIDADVDTLADVTEHYWFPMLAGLADLTSNQRPEVRSCALEVLFDLLNERGSKFSKSFWETIFHRVLFPIFDHVRNAGNESSISSGDEWPPENSVHSLQLLCNLFNTFYKEVCFMLPPLLSLLLDCAQKTDQTVVSISLGALMHLIEVGGHQFSEGDWNMLLKSIREASYTTQPLELLNALGFDSPKNRSIVYRDLEVHTFRVGDHELDKTNSRKHSPLAPRNIGDEGTATYINAPVSEENNQDSELQSNMDGSDAVSLQRSQTIGQRIMGNMMDNLFVRSLTSKSKNRTSEISVPSSPTKVPESAESDNKEEDTPLMGTIRAKCITQLLLLGAIDNIQKRFWINLKASQKIAIMEILFSLIEFAASYNSFSNLRMRMYHVPTERPPLNILRQELVGASIYLDVLQKTASGLSSTDEKVLEFSSENNSPSFTEPADAEQKLEGIAEEKLAAFCEQVLKDASDLQSTVGETTNMDVHRVLELRSPVIIKVLKGMCFMNNKIFRRHLREFYPLLTKLVCCDQMDIRNAVADLFKVQLKALLP